ncbi:ABC transporter permease [Paenibacillus thalictri]|uniref:ABC transporter permease n=1 Tax=Paenibacillus thalictri TaxID=2527873 RepID=A0A4V2J3U2_9BACL|nr:ABC transporter permease [Paenibacillus thalictri]TBL75624.1 ABC transporter permease [Paenibacillus thalictri]
MGAYITRRSLYLILQVFVLLTLMFILFRLVPGDPAALILGGNASQEEIDRLRHAMGLDQSIGVQYAEYLGHLIKGDLGQSISYNMPVLQVIADRIWPTLKLMLLSIVIAVTVGIPAGVVSGLKPRAAGSRALMLVWIGFLAVPNFWLGLLLVQLFAVKLNWLPAIGYGGLLAMIMPAAAISARLIALIARMTRTAMMEVLSEDFIRTAEAKGLSTVSIIFKHALRPALPPVMTMIGLQAGYLLGGSVVIENLFSYPGMGQLLLSAQSMRDYSLMQGITIFFVGSFLIINFAVDLLYGRIDPRIRYQ